MKKCTQCPNIKPFNEFKNNPKAKDGKRSVCRSCERKEHLIWQKTRKGKAAAKRAYMKKNNIVVVKENITNRFEEIDTLVDFNFSDKDKRCLESQYIF